MGGSYDKEISESLKNIERNTKKTTEGVVKLPELISV
jgi:hypothetical protein